LIACLLVLGYSLMSNKSTRTISAFEIYLPVVLAVSSIENYFYNGLGLWRFILFIFLVGILTKVSVRVQTPSQA